MDQADEGAGTQRIQAVDRAVALLKSVAGATTPPTALELAQACGINRSTAWRLLRTLEYHGLVDRDEITQRYSVGYGTIAVAAAPRIVAHMIANVSVYTPAGTSANSTSPSRETSAAATPLRRVLRSLMTVPMFPVAIIAAWFSSLSYSSSMRNKHSP